MGSKILDERRFKPPDPDDNANISSNCLWKLSEAEVLIRYFFTSPRLIFILSIISSSNLKLNLFHLSDLYWVEPLEVNSSRILG